MITISGSILIDRPKEDVFAFVGDYGNDPHWRSGVVEMRIDPPGEIHVGWRTHEVMRVMGRTTATEAEITEYVIDGRTAFRTVAGDLSAEGYRSVDAEGARTRFTYVAHAELDAWYRPFATLIEWVFNRRVGRDLARLKAILESPGPLATG